MNILYTATAHATGDGRNGHAATDDGLLDIDLRIPKEMGGEGGATNPEQLFAAGYAACFHSALKLVARKMRVPVEDSAVTAEVGLVKHGVGYGLQVGIEVELPGLDEAQARQLIETAHQVCPYSAAIRGNVEVQLSLA